MKNEQPDCGDWAGLLTARQSERLAYRFLLKGEAEARELSYAQLFAQAGSLARQLRARYAPGTQLMLLFEPGLDFCLAFWACLLAGMPAVPCYPPADPRLRERFMALARDAGAAGVLTTAAIKKLISLARWLMPALRRLDWIAIDSLPVLAGPMPEPVPAQQLAMLQYTSGSTGSPRGVMLSHANLWQNMLCLEGARSSAGERPGSEEVVVSWLPLYHDMGLMCGVVFPIFLNARSVLMSPLHFLQRPSRWLRALGAEGGTITAAPNFGYELCLKRVKDEQLEGIDLSRLDGSLNGAEMIRPATLRQFSERFAPWGLRPGFCFPSYGLAEATVFVTGPTRLQPPLITAFSRAGLQEHRVAPPASPEDSQELVSIGRPYGDTRLAIVDPDSCVPCEQDQVGEVWIRGGSVGLGYWQQPDATEAYFQARLSDGHGADLPSGPWLRSGDLGFMFEQNLYLCGRIKDLIILQGQNYAPQSFEAAAEAAHPAIRTGCVAAFGAGSPEGLVLLAEVRPETIAGADEIQAALRQAIATEFAVPVADLRLLPKASLPKTTSGKLRRLACKALYESDKLKPWRPKRR